MSNPYVSLAQGVGGAFGCLWGSLKLSLVLMLIAGACHGLYQAYQWHGVDEKNTYERGVDLCLSHGYPGGEVTVGSPVKPGSGYDRSSVSCYGEKEGVQVFFDYATVMTR